MIYLLSAQRIILCVKVRLRITLNFKWLFQLNFFFYFLKFIYFFTYFFKFIFWLCSMRDLSSPTGAQTHAPGSGSMSPNHWTGGEVFQLLFVF